jgi:hypothetical protein
MTVMEPLGYIRLCEAVYAVGDKIFGPGVARAADWRPTGDLFNPEIECVITKIAEQCAAGKIVAVYRTSTGGLENLALDIWHQPHWRHYFVNMTIDVDLPLVDENLRPVGDQPVRCTREIYLRRRDVDRFIETLPRAKRPPKAETARVSDVQVRKTVEQYLAMPTAPSLHRLNRHVKDIGLNIPRSRLRTEYHKQRPNLRRGRPSKNNPPE